MLVAGRIERNNDVRRVMSLSTKLGALLMLPLQTRKAWWSGDSSSSGEAAGQSFTFVFASHRFDSKLQLVPCAAFLDQILWINIELSGLVGNAEYLRLSFSGT